MTQHTNFTLGMAFGLLWGCTFSSSPTGDPKSGSANRPPIIQSAAITPGHILDAKMVSAQVDAQDPDGDLITFRYQWSCNGRVIAGQTSSNFSPRMLKYGDLLTVDLTPYDGKAEGPIYRTKAVPMGNALPQLTSIALEPREVRVGDMVQAKVNGSDADEDQIMYRFRWLRNNEEVMEGEKSVLDTTGFSRGDVVTVQVTPYDNEGGKGKSMFAEPVTIANSPPKITSMPPTTIQGGRYEYSVAADDADKDALVYSLEKNPMGMNIDQITGHIEWQIPPGTNGIYRVRVKVMDYQEGFAFQEFDLRFSSFSAAARLSLF